MMNCVQQYYNALTATHTRLNVISGAEIGGALLSLTYPNPFVPLALMDFPSEVESLEVSATATQDLYKSLLENMFIAAAQANIDFPLAGTPFDVTYEGNMPNYMKQYLTEAWNLGDTSPNDKVNLDSFLIPGGMMAQFWQSETANPDAQTLYQRLYQLAKDMRDITDPRLWGTPGTYTYPTATFPDLAAAITALSTGSTRGFGMLVLELKSIA